MLSEEGGGEVKDVDFVLRLRVCLFKIEQEGLVGWQVFTHNFV